jgi:hypothetical protein
MHHTVLRHRSYALIPKEKGPTCSQHHQTPDTLPGTDSNPSYHIHHRTPRHLLYLLNPQIGTLRTKNTQHHTELRESRRLHPPYCQTRRYQPRENIPFNIHRIITLESSSSRFISVHRTSTPTILLKSLSLSHQSQLQQRFD